MFVAKECCLTFLANPLGDLERRGIAGTSQPQLTVIVNSRACDVGAYSSRSLARSQPGALFSCIQLLASAASQPAAAGERTCSGRIPSPMRRAVMPCSHGTALINCIGRGTLRSRLAESSATLMILF